MKTEEEYRILEVKRIEKINNEPHLNSELRKIFIDKGGSAIDSLFRALLNTNNKEDKFKVIEDYKISVSERNLDLLKEFFNINEYNIKLIDKGLKKELKSISEKFLCMIPNKERMDYLNNNNFSLKYINLLKSHQLLNKN